MELKIKEIIQAAREQGWRYERTEKGHHRFFPPDKSQSAVLWSGTPSDPRAWQNSLAQMKRAGFIWPWGKRK